MPRKKQWKVVGLDPSWRSFGIAHVDGQTEAIKVHSYLNGSQGLKLLVAAVTGPIASADLVVIEGYSYGSRNGREKLGHLGEAVRDTCVDFATPYLTVAPNTLKKWATGQGHAGKEEVTSSAIELLGLSPHATHDEADALWLREAGLHMLGISAHIPPTERATALDKLQLPEGLKK